MLRPVIAPVESGEASDLHGFPVVAVVGSYARLRHDMYAVVSLERGLEHTEVAFPVVIWRAPHHHHRTDLFQLPEVADGRLYLGQSPVAPRPGLMEHVARYHRNVWLGLPRSLNQRLKAMANIQKSRVLAVFLRAVKTSDVPVARMKQFNHGLFLL